MTIAELIAMADEIRPNQVSKQTKTQWLNEVEHRVFDEVYCRTAGFCDYFTFDPYNYDENDDTVLAVPDTYIDVYLAYLYSKIDFTQAEIDRYNNDAALFRSAWDDFSGWWLRNHYPKPFERRHYVTVSKPWSGENPEDSVGVPGTQSDACGFPFGVCRHEECVGAAFPCRYCKKATGNNGDSTSEA